VTAAVLLFKTVEHNLFETLTSQLPFFAARIGSSIPPWSLAIEHPSALGNLEFMPCGYTSLPRVRVVNRGRGPWLRDAIDFASWLQLPHRISESWAFRRSLSCRGGVADAGRVGAARQGLSFQTPGRSARVSHLIAAGYLGSRSPKRETDRNSKI